MNRNFNLFRRVTLSARGAPSGLKRAGHGGEFYEPSGYLFGEKVSLNVAA
jgi:hypothetical protein